MDEAPIVSRSSAPALVATHQGTCQILDLILGPLRLDLLGLVVSLTDAQLQNLLTQLGIGDLSGGLSQLDLQRLLAALGLGSTPPA